jgi:hypothetical protein
MTVKLLVLYANNFGMHKYTNNTFEVIGPLSTVGPEIYFQWIIQNAKV